MTSNDFFGPHKYQGLLPTSVVCYLDKVYYKTRDNYLCMEYTHSQKLSQAKFPYKQERHLERAYLIHAQCLQYGL